MKIRSKNIVSGTMIIAVIISLFGINIGNHLCGMSGHSNITLLSDASPATATECEFATEPMPVMDDCSMIAKEDITQEDITQEDIAQQDIAREDNDAESCCSEESDSQKDTYGSITEEICCTGATDYLINSFDLNLPVDIAGFNKISSNVEFELPLNIQLNSIFETERKHFKEIVYHPYYSNYLHFIQRMLT